METIKKPENSCDDRDMRELFLESDSKLRKEKEKYREHIQDIILWYCLAAVSIATVVAMLIWFLTIVANKY